MSIRGYKNYIEVLVLKAQQASGEISCVSHAKSFDDCITRWGNKLIFWYNDSTGNTKTVDLELID